MLARAARRKLRRDAFRSSSSIAEQLTLPWLCPAQMRWAASVGPVHSSRTPSRRTPSTTPRHDTRSLATTADFPTSSLDSTPFQGLMQAFGTRPLDPDLPKVPQWDPSRPLVVHHVTATSPLPATPYKFGIGGDPTELHQNLYACLRVGRLDRATAIIHRLSIMYNPSAPELVDAHNVYLQAMLERAEQKHSNVNETSAFDESTLDEHSSLLWKEIESWYRTNMVRKAIDSNAATYVTLLRAAMNFLQGQEKKETIRQYLAEAEQRGSDVLDDINSSSDFTDDEWNALIELQSDKFHEPPSAQETQHMQISTPGGQALAIQHGLIPDPALSVKPVSQKGLGLSSLKEALSVFEPGARVAYPHDIEGTREEKDRAYLYLRQLRLESDAVEAAVRRWKAEDAKLQEMGIHGVLQSKPIQALMWHWHTGLAKVLEKELQEIKNVLANPNPSNLRDERHIFGPFLEGCSAEKLAALTVSRLLSSCTRTLRDDSDSLRIVSLSLNLGRTVEADINYSEKSRHEAFVRKIRRQTRKNLLSRLNKEPVPTSEKEVKDAQNFTAYNNFTQKEFPVGVRTAIGAMLLEKLLETAMITVVRDDPKTGKKLTSTQCAFRHHTGFVNGKRIGWIKPNDQVMAKLRNENLRSVQCIQLPMLIEPKPWSAFDEGGYYTVKENVVRTKSGDQQQRAYAVSAIENGDMDKVLAGLDVLGKVPWNINKEVYRVVIEAWNKGEGVAGLVPEADEFTRPAEPPLDASSETKAKYHEALRDYENKRGGHHSQRCFQNFQLEVARAFLSDTFYYPHSVDFRGRAYPVPPILNHIGADFSRGLLHFANGKELGTIGLQWLKVHLANLYGYDKASLKDREQFAMDHVKDIYDSATNPLGGKRWWTKAEDPWQCLACCFELKQAFDLPDPTRHVCHLPVHQDGTCNGLQHYAALGGDEAGANQVNLEPSDRPQDIYTGVAELVKEMVAKDAAKGKREAVFINGHITRKVVKRTVMTNVYGVTFMGAKQQVKGELDDMFPDYIEGPNAPNLSMVALYIAQKIFVALRKIFNGAQEIQYWLGECGDRITTSISAQQIREIRDHYDGKQLTYPSKYVFPKTGASNLVQKKLDKNSKAYKTGIIWTTPLKMPVVQPYRKDSIQPVRTNIQRMSVQRPSPTDIVDKRKQLQAFPPNFIHSLDATHMILSALKCSELGLDFAAVHDSFWTHAADIPKLNLVLRDAFVRMHSEDIIGRLSAEFKARYAGAMYTAKLRRTADVAKKISEWRRQFRAENKDPSITNNRDAPFAEVALESKRLEFLASEDPETRRKGEEMVTPTSIWLENADPLALDSFRLALLGDTKGDRLKVAKRRVLGAEAEAEGKDADALLAKAEHESEEVDAKSEAEAEPEDFEEDDDTPVKSKRHKYSSIKVWLPLTFPPVPKKGDWDVKRLRESKYFFS